LGELLFPWKSSGELGLIGALTIEWGLFCRALSYARIQLIDRLDILIWIGGDGLGNIIVRNVYNAMDSKLWSPKFMVGVGTFGIWILLQN